jgi:hypothetical protein
MFIKKEELDKRLSANRNLLERLKKESVHVTEHDKTRFKKNGEAKAHKQSLTLDEKALIATTALLSTQRTAAEVFDVSPDTAHRLANGENQSIINEEEREMRNAQLRDAIYSQLNNIREAAREKLIQVLGLINDETLTVIPDKDKAKSASVMANQLSAVIDRTIQKGSQLQGERSAHLHLYAPELRPVEAFTIKNINQVPSPKESISISREEDAQT